MRTLELPGLVLEPQVAAHAEAMFTVLADPAIYEYENAPPESLEWLRKRYERLETRRSGDERDQWLNWVICLPDAGPIGFVQATVTPDGTAAIAYLVSSAHWGRGIAGRAVRAMMSELVAHHGTTSFTAVLKRDNGRSMRLLERLGFTLASAERHVQAGAEPDEVLMQRDSAEAR